MNDNHIKLKEIEEKGGRVGGCWSVADFGCYHPRLIEFLVTSFPIKSVLDVGCGFGQALKHFQALGCNVMGIEFLDYAATRANVPVVLHDMEASPILFRGIDLAYSIEFVEHCASVSNSVSTLAQSKMICMSHALPGQAGHHHVSCFDDAFWIEKVTEKGFKHLPKLSKICRDFAGGYFGQSGLLFIRNDMIDQWCPNIGDHD